MSTNGSAGRLSPQSTTEWTSSIRISPLLGILRVRMPPRPIPNRQREIVREFSIMITLSGQSLHPINDSDSASRTERKGSPRRPPGESEDAALSPYAPKHARLMRGGKPLAIDVPRFLLPPIGYLQIQGNPCLRRGRLTVRYPGRAVVPNSSAAPDRSGWGRQAGPPRCVSTLKVLKRGSAASNVGARTSIGPMLTPLSRGTVTKRRRTRDGAPGSAARSNQRICPQR